jgi:hypothetical protein
VLPLKPLGVFECLHRADALEETNVVLAHDRVEQLVTAGFLNDLALGELCDNGHVDLPC